MQNGIFGDMFDFNGDGKLNVFEKSSEFAFLCSIVDEDEDDEDEFSDIDQDEDF